MARKKTEWRFRKPVKPSQGEPQLFPGPFGNAQWKISIGSIVAALIVLSLFNYFLVSSDDSIIPYSEFKAKIRSGEIRRVELGSSAYIGYSSVEPESKPLLGAGKSSPTWKAVPIADVELPALLDEKGVVYSAEPRESNALIGFLLNWVLPFGVMFLIWRVLFKRIQGAAGGNVLAFGQNKATIVAEGGVTTRFADVAGVDEAKEELEEVIDFLKSPKKYTDIGGKIPKGVLLVGPPGTGKTLLARAVAGEASVPFFRMSGAEFVEMFVGVGAARVRDLFKQAREKAPCIIFIDELDAIGKSRISGPMGGNDEREQTLNQLLVEMDGFDATSGLILLAATNRPDVLDPALLRPGRFDRQVLVDKPDLQGRKAILELHAKAVKRDESVDLSSVAKSTPGFAGADLANLVNEAALLAVRSGRKKVTAGDFEAAVERVIAGLEKKNRAMNESERRVVAYHETGHALVGARSPGADPVHKVSIVPRGFGALGYTLQLPVEDRYIVSEEELLGKIDVLLGGRAAEQVVFDRVSTGAANDLARATEIARSMIMDYGMSERFRNVALNRHGQGGIGQRQELTLSRDYSEETQRYVDEEIAKILAARYERVLGMLSGERPVLDRVAASLLEKETLDAAEFRSLIAPESEAVIEAAGP